MEIYKARKPVISAQDFEELYKLRKQARKNEEEPMQKVEEAKSAATQTTLEMMDRHIEIVKKSQELIKAQAKKRALERLTQKRIDESREVLAEMAVRNAERRDFLEAARLKKL